MLRKLLGPRLSIKQKEGTTFILWSNYGIELIMLVWLLVVCASVLAGIWGEGMLMGYRMIPLSWLQSSVLLILTTVCLAHILFNRKSLLVISPQQIRFRLRTGLPLTFQCNPSELQAIRIAGKSDQDQDDLGAYETSHPLFLLLKNGKNVRLGSFGEADSQQIYKALQKHAPALKLTRG